MACRCLPGWVAVSPGRLRSGQARRQRHPGGGETARVQQARREHPPRAPSATAPRQDRGVAPPTTGTTPGRRRFPRARRRATSSTRASTSIPPLRRPTATAHARPVLATKHSATRCATRTAASTRSSERSITLPTEHPKSAGIATELVYFRKHRRRMRSAELTAAGLGVGSGIVGAACRTLVAQRPRRVACDGACPERRPFSRRADGSRATAPGRAWALVAATFHAEVTVLANVVATKPGSKADAPARSASR